jgi:hypothetical protein
MSARNSKPRIAIFSGPAATIQNTPPLVTSNKAREKYGLPLLKNPDGSPVRFDALRPQRLAAPVTIYVEQFSARPLERDAAELYAPPDGYIDPTGKFHKERQGPKDVPVYEIALKPEDGVYPLPYMARQADGKPWDGDEASPGAPAEQCRQPFFPDGSRLLEEIDRLCISEDGQASMLSSKADFDFYRPAPSGGYTKGLPASLRVDVGEGDIPPEVSGRDFFVYRPRHLRRDLLRSKLAHIANVVQQAMASGKYVGGVWLEGSPSVEETTYWLNLLIDTQLPMAGNASQRPHGAASNDGDRNIIDSVDYILSRIWADADGKNSVGVVLIQDEQIFTSREVQKADARPGGYIATGGHGGIVGSMGQPGPASLTFRPVKRHTYLSEVNLTKLPASVNGVRREAGALRTVTVRVKNDRGELLGAAVPKVTIVKSGNYTADDEVRDAGSEVDILARIEKNLRDEALAGFVAEGQAPFGGMGNAIESALRVATFSGMPVVKVARGNAEGMVDPARSPFCIAGSNLTATKARLLLIASMMKLGSLPPAADPRKPTSAEADLVLRKLAEYQVIFDTH